MVAVTAWSSSTVECKICFFLALALQRLHLHAGRYVSFFPFWDAYAFLYRCGVFLGIYMDSKLSIAILSSILIHSKEVFSSPEGLVLTVLQCLTTHCRFLVDPSTLFQWEYPEELMQ